MNWHLKKFSDLTIDELYNILKLRTDVFIVEQQCAYEDCDGKDKEANHLFLGENQEIIAYLRIVKKGVSFKEISIGRVVVHPKHRGQGLGFELMRKAINIIHNEFHEPGIRISAQAHLAKFYQSLGFEATSEIYFEDNIPHVEMFCNLSEPHLAIIRN